MRIAVIGGLASGPAAAAEASRRGAEVVLFEESDHVSVGACEIPYYVAKRLDAEYDLEVMTPRRLARTRGIEVKVKHRVTRIDPDAGRLTVRSLLHEADREESFDRFILATGARPRRLGIEGEMAPGVFAVRGYESAMRVRGWLDREPVRHVVIVGGGFIGLEMAEAMRDRGLRATVLEPTGRPLGKAFSKGMAGPLEEAMRAEGVLLRAERPTRILTESDGRVQGVRTGAGEIIGCQAVIVSVGLEPRTELADALSLRKGRSGALSVNDRMQTSHRRVYACGDVVEVPRLVDGAPVYWPLAPVARRAARVAARNAADRNGSVDRFRGITGAIAVKAFGVEAARVGLDASQAEEAGLDTETVEIQHLTRTTAFPGSEPISIQLTGECGSGRLLGGQMVAAERAALRADVLAALIQQGAVVEDLAQHLDLVYNPPLAPSVDPLKIAASSLRKALGRRN